MADIRELHARSVEDFTALVANVPPDAWSSPTPCSDWDVRALVNHVVGEEAWVPPLLEGATIADVGDRFDGDLLGDDPTGSAGDAAKGAIAAFAPDDAMDRIVHLSFGDTPASEYAWQLFGDHLVHGWDLAVATGQQPRLPDDAMDRTVHLSFGDTPASEYAWQLFGDHLVHGWDLAVATGQQPRLPDDAVAALARWFDDREDMYRGGGAISAKVDVAAGASPADRLLGRFGRDPGWSAP